MQARGGRGEKNAAAAALAQFAHGALGGDQHRPVVEIERQFIGRHIEILERRRAGMADVIPQQVETTEMRAGPGHDILGKALVAKVAAQGKRLPAGRLDLGDHAVGRLFGHVDHHDLAPFAGHPGRAGAPHARASRRDQRNLALKPHVSPLENTKAVRQADVSILPRGNPAARFQDDFSLVRT
jgi:hypothetical protein